MQDSHRLSLIVFGVFAGLEFLAEDSHFSSDLKQDHHLQDRQPESGNLLIEDNNILSGSHIQLALGHMQLSFVVTSKADPRKFTSLHFFLSSRLPSTITLKIASLIYNGPLSICPVTNLLFSSTK